MTENGDNMLSKKQKRVKRELEDLCERLKQKYLKMNIPVNVNNYDFNIGRFPLIYKNPYSGEEKCTIMEGCKFFTGENGLLLRIERLDKAELLKLETPEEKHAKEKLIAKQSKSYAKAALAHYNRQEDVDFELVKVLNCSTFCVLGSWHHINFEAKPRNFKCSPKLFFAELYGNALRVTCCCMLKPKGSDASALKGCYFCRSYVRHPDSGFRAGGERGLRVGKYGGIPVDRGPVLPQWSS